MLAAGLLRRVLLRPPVPGLGPSSITRSRFHPSSSRILRSTLFGDLTPNRAASFRPSIHDKCKRSLQLPPIFSWRRSVGGGSERSREIPRPNQVRFGWASLQSSSFVSHPNPNPGILVLFGGFDFRSTPVDGWISSGASSGQSAFHRLVICSYCLELMNR